MIPEGNRMNPNEPLVTSDPGRMGGIPVFAGTRVPVRTLFDHLVAGDGLEVFLDDFPTVTRELAIAVLQSASETLVANARAA